MTHCGYPFYFWLPLEFAHSFWSEAPALVKLTQRILGLLWQLSAHNAAILQGAYIPPTSSLSPLLLSLLPNHVRA